MKYDYFIASRWRNKETVLALTEKLRAKGKKVYCFLESKDTFISVDEDPEIAMQKYEQTPDWRTNEGMKTIFESDMQALQDSAALILLLPAGKSSHVEAGVAYGLGKKCIVVGEQKEAESLYFIFSEHYNSIDQYISSIDI